MLKLIGFWDIYKEPCLDTMKHSLITADIEHKEKVLKNFLYHKGHNPWLYYFPGIERQVLEIEYPSAFCIKIVIYSTREA